ncbi:hypothetical protein PFL02_20830 [Pseudomonas fluorescens]|nr:hypothetical protein PFL02_20830 [Pseudomonas fluorescens]
MPGSAADTLSSLEPRGALATCRAMGFWLMALISASAAFTGAALLAVRGRRGRGVAGLRGVLLAGLAELASGKALGWVRRVDSSLI